MPVFTEEPQEEEQPKQFDEVRFLLFLSMWAEFAHRFTNIINSKSLHSILMFDLPYMYLHL